MRLRPKQILPEKFSYYSLRSVEELKLDMQHLSDKTDSGRFQPNLTVEFVDNFNFRVRPRRSSYFYNRGLDIDRYESSIITIVGNLSSNQSDETIVKFVVRPNLSIPFFFFFDILIGLSFLVASFINDSIQARTIGLLFTFAAPIAILFAMSYFKRQFKDRFTKTFRLEAFN